MVKRTKPRQHVRHYRSGKKTMVNKGVKRKLVKRRMAWNVAKARREGNIIKYMSPEAYLRKTRTPQNLVDEGFFDHYTDTGTGRLEHIDRLGKHIVSKDTLVDVPFVQDDPSGFHEGRHRALAAKNAGVKEIPVSVDLPPSKARSLANKFYDKAFPNLKRSSYRDEWVSRFESGRPQERMDSDRRRVYARLLKEEGLL